MAERLVTDARFWVQYRHWIRKRKKKSGDALKDSKNRHRALAQTQLVV